MPDGSTWPQSPSSAVRRPRARLLLNGTPLTGLYECSVQANNALKADKWDAHLSLYSDPQFSAHWWGDQKDLTVDVQAQFLPDGAAEGAYGPWTSMVTGKVDDMHLDICNGAVHLTGRDLVSVFIDTKLQKAYPNYTTSKLLAELAAGHGMKADLATTTRLIGSFYKSEHDKLTLGNFSKQTTEWDLICYLCRQEGLDVWVDAAGLHTRPAADPAVAGATPFPIVFTPPSSDASAAYATLNVAIDVQLERSLTIAKDVRVTVKSWNAKSKGATTRTVDGKGSEVAKGKEDAASGGMQTHVFVVPNLSPDAALKYAQNQARILTQLERIVTVRMPGELTLTPRDLVSLAGTGTSWDQTYFLDTLERKISWEAGFEQTIRLKNSSPRTETTVQ